MRFYSSSTPGEAEETGPLNSRAQTATLLQGTPTSYDPQPIYFYYFNNYCNQFLYLSNQLSQELVLNNSLINLRTAAAPAETLAQEQLKMDEEIKTTDSNKNASQYQELPNQIFPIRKQVTSIPAHKHLPKKKKAPTSEEDSYKPDDQDSREFGCTHVSESKNIPKNYGKAVVNFIQRNDDYVRTVLDHLGMDYSHFMHSLQKLRCNLNTIMQLRSLWLDEDNPYAKAYRIFTMQYLRKHSLSYIFNSRVENFHKHIKYRYKMIESVSDPRNFTHMKEF